jgi:cytochrome b6-f complex iron-sulfur subunit
MAQATVSAGGMSRREFLFYVWGASMALFAAQFTGLFIWFALPRFREGEFGGTFRLSIADLPPKNDPPFNRADGRFWLVNLDTRDSNVRMYRASDETEDIIGIAAIYKVCTHLGCIYPWNETNERFECPCHGSKYRLDGRRIESPAPRTLDRFAVTIKAEDGTILAQSDSEEGHFKAVPIDDILAQAAVIEVDTGDRLDGPSQTLICDLLNNCP